MSYFPRVPPTDPALMQGFLLDELQALSRALNEPVPFANLALTSVAPKKPRDGAIYYADGVNWKPNGAGGRGIWYYRGDTATYVQLG